MVGDLLGGEPFVGEGHVAVIAVRGERDGDDRLHFEAVYRPYLADGPVVFTDYTEVATNQPG